MPKIVAVVVTYNRKKLLIRCINKLLEQNYPMDILIIDNLSTDGTREALDSLIQLNKIIYYCTGKNLGGAGGFSEGIKYAYGLGYDYFWIMDDDCMPKFDALKELMCINNNFHNQYGFLASKVLWKNNHICKMNIQRKTPFRVVNDFHSTKVRVSMASFVSLLVPRIIVKEVGLPIKEFFIWTDDWEFTRRISKKYPCFLCNKSIVIHESSSNIGANIATDSYTRLKRYQFLYRNDVYLYKREGIRGLLYEFLRLICHITRVLFKAKDYRLSRIKIILIGTFNGIKFAPKIQKFNR